MMIKKYTFICVFSCGVFAPLAYAGHLQVTNENKKVLDIKIEAEGDRKAVLKKQIPADHQSSFEVTQGQLKGSSYYSIKGDLHTFTPGGKCDHLSVEKDYKVTFTDDTRGTTCVAEEVK